MPIAFMFWGYSCISGYFRVFGSEIGASCLFRFSHIRNEMNGTAVLTEPQRRWVALQRVMLKLKPQRLLLPPEYAARGDGFNGVLPRSGFPQKVEKLLCRVFPPVSQSF